MYVMSERKCDGCANYGMCEVRAEVQTAGIIDDGPVLRNFVRTRPGQM